LLAVGAILRFAVTVHTHGFNIHTIGVILMIAGGVGLVLSLLLFTVWADHGRTREEGPGDYAGRGPRDYAP
jgi:hypothetical protein